MLNEHFKKFIAASNAGAPYEPYGPEVGEGLKARYEYWPSMQVKSPILYICACALLAGDVNATTFSERMHSPLARITSKFRASMKPDKVERLTLSLFLFRAWIKDELKRAEIEALLDNEELAEEYDDTVDDSPPEDDDAAA